MAAKEECHIKKHLNIFKSLLFFSSILFVSFAQAQLSKNDCLHEDNVICHKLIKLNSKMGHKRAYKLSNEFHQIGKKYNIPSDILISIAYQESSFRENIVRTVTGFVADDDNKFVKVEVGTDFCMMQINIVNIKKMHLDTQKLLDDSAYCIEAGAKILSQYQEKHSDTEEDWWTRYNAVTKENRAIYLRKVSRHLSKIQERPLREDRQLASNPEGLLFLPIDSQI